MKRRVPSKARAKGVPSPTAKHYRNLVRGVLGAAQSNAFSKEAIDRAKLYRNGLRGTLVSARSDLSVDERQEFLTWLQRLSKTGGGQIERALAFDLIVNLLVSSRISLVDEFKWIAARLSPHIDALREFRTLAEQLNCSFWRNEQVEVERLAAKIEEEFGPSIWSIETNLALTQFYHGLEAQKKYAAKIRRAYPKGLPAYISHFVSIRNEDRSTMRVFRHDAIRKIESADVMPRARTYLLYKIADVFTGTASEISAILATEQGQSILDIYETVVDVIQRLVKLGRAKRVSAAVLPLLDVLTAVGDFRVEKLRVSLGAEPTGSLEIRDSHALKHLISGQIATAFRSAKEVLAADPTDIWASFEVALCDALALRPPSVSFGNVWARVQNDISNVMLRREGFEAATGALEKFSRNLRNLHTAAAIGDLNAFCAASRAVPTYSLSSASLNAKKFGPEDLLLSDSAVRPHLAQVMGRIVDDSCIDFWLGRGSQLAGEEHAVAEYLKSLIYYRDGDTATALDVANRAWVNALPVAIRGAWAAVTIDLALARSELDLAIVLIADEAARRPVSSSILPVEFAIDERPWGDLGSHSDKLALAICLHVLWKKTNNELRATHLRFAFEDFITASGCEKPSELGQLSANRSDRLIYFLRFVCIPLVMDQAAIFDSSRDVTEERVAVCKRLSEIDPGNSDHYEEEIQETRRNLLIQDGLQIVDSSRIHVDTAAISRWAEPRYAESFARYEALVKAGIGIAEDLEKLVRATVKTPLKAGDNFPVPDNEADALLLEMFIALAEQFLHNPEHGLHFYLGKRIRHGTITGHIRGPLDSARLITQRTTELGNYLANTYWLEKLSFATAEKKSSAQSAFDLFAARYDELTSRLRDEELHVKSKEHERGIFSIPITALAFRVLRSTVQESLGFQNFLANCYIIFWVLLTPSLDAARQLLRDSYKSAATDLFDGLQDAIRQVATHDAAYHELGTAIRETSLEVQNQFDLVSDWFRRTEAQQVTHLFTLEEILDIAVESALKTHKSFSPRVETRVSGELRASAPALIIVADIIFIIIDNVCRRSEGGTSPGIIVTCGYDENSETLEIEVRNEVGQSIDRSAVDRRLEGIRQKISHGDIKIGAQSERGSGLMKIASITRQSAKSGLEFGFTSEGKFSTKVRLAVRLKERAVAYDLEGMGE